LAHRLCEIFVLLPQRFLIDMQLLALLALELEVPTALEVACRGRVLEKLATLAIRDAPA
jgi:hypothetical protein